LAFVLSRGVFLFIVGGFDSSIRLIVRCLREEDERVERNAAEKEKTARY